MSLAGPMPSAPSPQHSVPEVLLRCLMERLAEDDVEALDELYRLTREEVARTLHQLTGQRTGLQRLVTDVFLALGRDLVPDVDTSLRHELRRRCVQVARRELGRWRREEPEGNDALSTLHRALATTSDRARIAFVLAHVAGWRVEEIAAATDDEPQRVAALLVEARVALTRALQSHEERT